MNRKLSRRSLFSSAHNNHASNGDLVNQTKEQDNLIAEMAQGFIQAQAKIADKSENSNEEVVVLLQKLNEKVNQLTNANQNQESLTQSNDGTEQTLPAVDVKQVIKQLFNNPQASSGKNNTKDNKGTSNEANQITMQTVSQVLAQAQYELATELENSLQKLREVISESEVLANKISNLLGDDKNKKNGGT